MCCPTGCGTPGSTCCGDEFYCTPEQTCCGEGCADQGNTCCGSSHQCEPDWQCCPNTDGKCAPPDAKCCGPDIYCGGVPGASVSVNAICCQDPADGDYYCSPGPECLKTWILDLSEYPGQDETWENLCRGIQRWAGYNAATPNQIVLTWPGPKNSAVSNANRIAAGCENGNPCNEIFGGSAGYVRWSCEEFPPAASLEGGQAASIICIPQSINSSLGSLWRWANNGKNGQIIRCRFFPRYNLLSVVYTQREILETKAVVTSTARIGLHNIYDFSRYR